MRNFLVLVAAVLVVGTACAESPVSVEELVRQLGDPKFAVREAAQRELLKRGEGIVPELDKLAKGVDAETAERLRKIRYELVGYKDDIRRLLEEVREEKDGAAVLVSPELRGLIAGHQPGAGDMLLSILADRKQVIHRRALRTFVSTWDVATPDQIDRYIQQSVSLTTKHRPKFPAKVGAMISFEAQIRDGWTGWPAIDGPKKFDFRCRAMRYLDGKPYEKPFDYQYPFGTVGWYKVGELAEGAHTINAILEYEFTQRGDKRKGEIRSRESTFEVVSADTPDLFKAPKTKDLIAKVHASFFIRENRRQSVEAAFQMPSVPESLGDWHPQVTWKGESGDWFGLSCPSWQLSTALPVDLCFDVEILDLKSGKSYAADPIVVVLGQTTGGYVTPRDPRLFARDRDGFVSVKVLLKPSRSLALTDQRITNYYSETISSGELRMKITPPSSPSTKSK